MAHDTIAHNGDDNSPQLLQFVFLQTEAWYSELLSCVSRLKVWSVRLIIGLRDEGHVQSVKIFPIHTFKERMIPQFYRIHRVQMVKG